MSVRVLCLGDYAPGESTLNPSKLHVGDLFGTELCDAVSQADLAMVNVEAPFVHGKKGIQKTGPLIKASPEWAHPLGKLGVRLGNLANNHIYDYGIDGLKSTIAALGGVGIRSVGAGPTLEDAVNPVYVDIAGSRLAIINVCENEWGVARRGHGGAAPIDPIDNARAIQYARKRSDILLVIVHAGNEMTRYPPPHLVKLYRFYVDQGANAVVGHHPHVLQGYEMYNSVPIIYSLGNFVFPKRKRKPEGWYEGTGVCLEFSGSGMVNLKWIPFRQFDETQSIVSLGDEERVSFFSNLKKLSLPLSEPEQLALLWRSELKEQADVLLWYLSHGERFMQVPRVVLQRVGLLSSIVRRRGRTHRLRLHLMRAESLRALVVDAMEEYLEQSDI